MRCALAVVAFILSAVGPQATERPNIILFLVDDYDKPETSVYGGKALTPTLDRMGREGMRFDNMHVTSTVCTPARYTFLTGRYAGSSNSKTYLEAFPKGDPAQPAFNVGLEMDNRNVGQVLRDAGYTTGFVGKYHVHDKPHGHDRAKTGDTKTARFTPIPKNAPFTDALNRQTFANEKIFRTMIQERGFDWVRNVYWENIKKPFGAHNPEWTHAATMAFLDEHGSKDAPFYLHICTTLLHGPNRSWFKSLSEPLTTGEGRLDKPLGLMDRDSLMPRLRAAGLGEDELGYLWMDDCLALILARLEKLGIDDNTVLAFAADHGSTMKGSLFSQGGTEIPCLIRWPAGIRGGVICDELVQNTDFVPTWFDLAGAKLGPAYGIDGRSLRPLFTEPTKPIREVLYAEQGPARAVKTKDWSYITLRYTEANQADLKSRGARAAKTLLGLGGGVSRSATARSSALDADQLYDRKQDPAEQTNLAAKPSQAEQLKVMRLHLQTALGQFPDRPYGEFQPGKGTLNETANQRIVDQLKHAVKTGIKDKKRK